MGDALARAFELALLLGAGYLVATTRLWRVPRFVHLAAWMTALLAASALGGLAFGVNAWHERFSTSEPHGIDAVIDMLVAGFVFGITATIGGLVILAGCWLGDRLREGRDPARVALGPRIAVAVLHVPFAAALVLAAMSCVAGGVNLWRHDDVPTELDAGTLVATGVALWLVAIVHADRLLAIGAGHPLTRLALGAIGVAATVVTWLEHGPRVLVTAWCVAQLVALVSARGRGRGARPPGRAG